MRPPSHNTATLPKQLKDELGIQDDVRSTRSKRNGVKIRKEVRKAGRTEKKNRISKKIVTQTRGQSPVRPSEVVSNGVQKRPLTASLNPQDHKDLILPRKVSKKSLPKRTRQFLRDGVHNRTNSSNPSSPSFSDDISPGTRNSFAADDAEIAALESALGIKRGKKLPNSFGEDGLDVLLDEIESGGETERLQLGKRNRSDEDSWLNMKRRKASKTTSQKSKHEIESIAESDKSASNFEASGDVEDSRYESAVDDKESGRNIATGQIADLDHESGFHRTKVRENPYKAPETAAVAVTKYIPPFLRNQSPSETEDQLRLRRQIQGLLNRLSEANMISVLTETEALYRNHPRHHVSAILLDLLLGLASDSASLQDTFLILHAGFMTSLYKIIGQEFGAQLIQKIDEQFVLEFGSKIRHGKKLVNLVSLLSDLYTFQVIGSGIIYDYVRSLINDDFSEATAELLLKILRNSGPQLRQDDPSALREIVALVHSAAANTGEASLSVRTKFMVETMNALKNNRMKTGIAASAIASEHVVRMKKLLGSLNTRNVKATEPLRIRLKDIRDSERRGRWWLIGSTCKGPVIETEHKKPSVVEEKMQQRIDNQGDDVTFDLLQLAKEQRMNTDIRRSIFIAVLSATDCNDAFQRIVKLRLKKAQEIEIPKVLIQCAGAEQTYNPYYTLLSRKVCSDRRLKMAFQFSLWDLFKQLGEKSDEEESEIDSESMTLNLGSIVNLAKLFGILIADGGLSLNVLKNLDFVYIQSKTKIFVEVLLVNMILFSQRDTNSIRDEHRLVQVFLQVKENPGMARGLQYFLKKTVNKAELAGTEADRETVKWGCKIARDLLSTLAT